MKNLRDYLFAMLVGCHLFAGELWAEEVLVVPPKQRQEMVTLIDELVRLGLPDTKGGEYFVGQAYVQQQFDPAVEKPVVPLEYSRIRETVPGTSEMIYKSIVPGPHIRLADGNWLLGLGFVVTPDERHQVFTKQMEKRELGTLFKDSHRAYPFEPDASSEAWFEKVDEAERDQLKSGVLQGVPLWRYLDLPRNNTTLGICFLLRAGATDAELLCYTVADTRCRDYWRMQPWSGIAAPFDPTEKYAAFDEVEANWEASIPTYQVEPLATAFRRDLHRYFFHMLMSDDSPYSPETAASLAKATLDPQDPQQLGNRIDALLVSRGLPRTPAASARLGEILQSWGEVEQRMVTRNTGTDQVPAITTEFEVVSNFTPTCEQLPDLMTLLDDDRPSRWTDYQGTRCVGESALRAIALVLQEDPLQIAGHDPTKPWTPEVRAATNAALRKWWEKNKGDYTPEVKKKGKNE